MSKIATLLTVHNRKEKTLACLEVLFNCLLPEKHQLEVFLVDDGCTDRTVDAVKEKFSQVNIIQGNGNLYWNRGMHLAWTIAAKTKDYDYYLWLNDDTFLYSHAICKLLELSVVYENKSIIVGSTCALSNKEKITYGGHTFKHGLLTNLTKPQYCDFFNGNIVLFPRSVYERVGINDPVFHHGLGDFDYGLRAGKSGIKSIVVPAVSGKCEKHSECPRWSNLQVPFRKRWTLFFSPLGANPVEFFKYRKRHFGLFQALLTLISNFIHLFFPQLWKMEK